MNSLTKVFIAIAIFSVAAFAVPAVAFAATDVQAEDLPSSVTICHRPDEQRQQTMTIENHRAVLHLGHGDRLGQCVVPLPDTAFGVPIDPNKGYFVAEINDGVYWVTEGAYTMMFLTTGEGVIVVDAPPSIGQNILSAIAEVTSEPITHVIYSHSHADHIGAAALYPSDATYIAHEDTLAQLNRSRPFQFGLFAGGNEVPEPDTTFSSEFTLTVGDKTLELTDEGDNHDLGNIFVYAPDQKVLMLVDVIFPGWSPFKNLALAEDVPGFIEAHDQILGFDFDAMVAGHLGRLATRDDVETQKEYIFDIQANAAEALQTVDFFGIAQETGFQHSWLLFDTYLNTVSQVCTDLTLPEWSSKLGDADVFTFGHCFEIVESLRID